MTINDQVYQLGRIAGALEGLDSRLDRLEKRLTDNDLLLNARLGKIEEKCQQEPFSKKAAAIFTGIASVVAAAVASLASYFMVKGGQE